jgi:predicted AAA+ superfamily ATPase
LDALKAHLGQKEISLIVGPRQAGKTTLMVLLKDHLESRGEKTIYLNFDIESDQKFFATQQDLVQKISMEIGNTGGYVFLDEIQRKKDAGLFLKGIYDMNLPYKLIVSGSGSLELKERIHESLAGRKQVFVLSTVSFLEFINYKTGYKYENRLAEFFSLEENAVRRFFEEYLMFGGYPKVILEETVDAKRKAISELYQSYLERDISSLLGVQKTEHFSSLVRLLASQIGSLANTAELASTLGISAKTVVRYLWYLEKTFLVDRISPYFKNLRKEITKSPIYYFGDLGMRNYALGIFGTPPIPSESGFLFQNFINNLLKKQIEHTPARIHYWRTTDKAEVDFVIDQISAIVPIEVKYKKLDRPEIPRAYRNFVSWYKPKKGYVVHLGTKHQTVIDGTAIDFLPFGQFALKQF